MPIAFFTAAPMVAADVRWCGDPTCASLSVRRRRAQACHSPAVRRRARTTASACETPAPCSPRHGHHAPGGAARRTVRRRQDPARRPHRAAGRPARRLLSRRRRPGPAALAVGRDRLGRPALMGRRPRQSLRWPSCASSGAVGRAGVRHRARRRRRHPARRAGRRAAGRRRRHLRRRDHRRVPRARHARRSAVRPAEPVRDLVAPAGPGHPRAAQAGAGAGPARLAPAAGSSRLVVERHVRLGATCVSPAAGRAVIARLAADQVPGAVWRG